MPKTWSWGQLTKFLRKKHGIVCDITKGKGSHRVYKKDTIQYTIPFHGDAKDILPCYIKNLERTFKIKIPR